MHYPHVAQLNFSPKWHYCHDVCRCVSLAYRWSCLSSNMHGWSLSPGLCRIQPRMLVLEEHEGLHLHDNVQADTLEQQCWTAAGLRWTVFSTVEWLLRSSMCDDLAFFATCSTPSLLPLSQQSSGSVWSLRLRLWGPHSPASRRSTSASSAPWHCASQRWAAAFYGALIALNLPHGTALPKGEQLQDSRAATLCCIPKPYSNELMKVCISHPLPMHPTALSLPSF